MRWSRPARRRTGRRWLRRSSRWPGELLPEDAYEPWAQRHANRIREWRTRLVMKLVEDDLVERDPQTAVALLAPVVAANPLHEPVHRAMMRALAAAGRRAEALVMFERLRTVLQQELAAEPEPQTRQLYRDLLASGRQDSGSAHLRSPPRATNLPARVSALVGRGRELEETARILADRAAADLDRPGWCRQDDARASSWLAGITSAIATAQYWSSWPRWPTAT